jgi:hypothetical protein
MAEGSGVFEKRGKWLKRGFFFLGFVSRGRDERKEAKVLQKKVEAD